MAIRTGRQASGWVAVPIEPGRRRICARVGGGRDNRLYSGIISGNFLPVRAGQLLRDRAHGEMLAPAIGIIVELALEIAGIEPGKTRRFAAIAFSLQAMTGETGCVRTRIGPAKGNHFARGAKAAFHGCRVASGQQDQKGETGNTHIAGNRSGAARVPQALRLQGCRCTAWGDQC